MNSALSTCSTVNSELREAPSQNSKHAGPEALFVLNHNKPAGYVGSNKLMARNLDELANWVVTDKASQLAESIGKARRILLDEL